MATSWIDQAYGARIPCASVNKTQDGQEIFVLGWVFRYRDQGGLIFVDLRDRSGIVQLVFDRSEIEEKFDEASSIRSEFVLAARGKVRLRSKEAINPSLETGEVEILINDFDILSKSQALPFPLDEYADVGEETRLKFRYLDLRREELRDAMIMRSKLNQAIRAYLEERGYLEVETPVLNKSTPEGARDFLVPARLSPGKFYALPQSPQIFKQILMVGGLEKYFQIVKCFRDEDFRADRQPEFTQLDMELSFVNESMVMDELEGLWSHVIKKVFDVTLPTPFARISYHDAMEQYGSDRPDLRFEMKLVDIADIAMASNFGVFKKALEGKSGRVKVLRVPGGASLSRKDIDDLTHWVQTDFRAGGLAWMKHEAEGLKSVISKFFEPEQLKELETRTGSQQGDLLLFGADKEYIVHATLGALRLRLGKQLGMIPEDTYAVTWVTDFPLFDRDENGELYSVHHPFTAPVEEDMAILEDPARFKEEGHKIRSRAYDLVINGSEAGGGSIRIHRHETQMTVLKALGISEEDANDRFGFLLNALRFGAPPHGGIAFGLDRIMMLFLHRDSIRDVIAFPKTQRGACLMSDSPSTVEIKQLQELRLRLISGS
ncbi:MAG: aspartate--tRNA ligase [Leptospiraceae bacterium]|nr:aspartate--tRNA ligase [Leptospiraceae bacterium]